jgi:hypothetical protein
VAETGKDESEPRPGKGRPPFAEGFPADPDLDALLAAFEAGDFARVRGEAKRIAQSSKDAAVKQAAEVVLARTRADPLQLVLIAVSAALLVVLSAWWIVHSGKG